MEADKVLLREQALRTLRDACTEENFWNCIVAFQGYPFLTSSGLPFTYTLKMGRRGAYTKELFIDRREHSKSLSWSSVRLAFHEACKREDRFFFAPQGDRRCTWDQLQLQSVGVFRCDSGTRRSQKEMDVKKVFPRYSWTKRLRRIIITMKT